MEKAKFNYTKETRKISDLQVHPLIQKFLGNTSLKEAYLEGIKYYGHFELPIITKKNEVLTHVLDFLAAKALKQENMEVVICNLEESELPMFAILKHLTQAKNYLGIYDAIGFFTDYFKTDVEGMAWAGRIKGDMDDRLAFVLGCSASQVKRIRTIGNKKPAELGLIQQGQRTFQEVLDQIRDDESKGGEEGIPTAAPKAPIGGPSRAQTKTQTSNSYQYFTATISYCGGDQVEVTVSENAKKVVVNGKEIADLRYKYFGDDDNGKNTEAYSHVFCPEKVNDASYQFILENPSKLFN